MVELRDLRSLVAVYENRHFGKAAEDLGLTQPAISKSIQRVEQAFGFQLFDRTRSQVLPTAVCEVLVIRARAILASITEMNRTARMIGGLEIGSLCVGVGPAMSESFVTDAITEMVKLHPGVQIDVRVDHWQQLSEWLVAGEVDLFIADQSTIHHDRRFVTVPLKEEILVWFCRQHHPLSAFQMVTRDQLIQYPLATPRMPPWAISWFQEIVAVTGDDQPSVALPTIRCENYSMLKRMVMNSDCISAALLDTIAQEVSEDRLRVLPTSEFSLKTQAGIVHLRDRTLSPLATAFVDQVKRCNSD